MTEALTPATLAARLSGRAYRHEITRDEEREAKAAGLVVVFGSSDDLVEFRGAICAEIGAYDGTTTHITTAGLLPSWESIDRDDEAACERYFENKRGGAQTIDAPWCAEPGGPAWTFRTTIPHATFDILEDGELFCRGIVFALTASHDASSETATAQPDI
jgi:hypothetical protein